MYTQVSLDAFKKELGPLAFLFWMEMGILCLIVPWALLNGELQQMLTTPYSAGDWGLLWVASAMGGVRALSQLMLLSLTSARASSGGDGCTLPYVG